MVRDALRALIRDLLSKNRFRDLGLKDGGIWSL